MKQARQKSLLISVVDDPLIWTGESGAGQGRIVNLPRTTSNTRCAHWSCGGTWCTAQLLRREDELVVDVVVDCLIEIVWALFTAYSTALKLNTRALLETIIFRFHCETLNVKQNSSAQFLFFRLSFKCPSNGSPRMSVRRTFEVLFPAMRCTHRRWSDSAITM